jgi:signal transduction histidine kinase/serine/threonine protein kinase/tetratricopeptide (TPR) repeat protein
MIIDSRYEELGKIGAGLWATVYKVRDLRTGHIHALKLFHKLNAEEFYERFSAEDMLHITKIEHPNLLQVVNFGNKGKHVYYLSEFYDGRSLSDFKLKKGNVDLLYEIIVQICYALNALHLQNIIHRDLKPENIMYKSGRGGLQVKVLDYGFSKIDVQQSQNAIIGSLPYVAPEIYLGRGAVPQSDYYSLGVTLYRICTGTYPFLVEQISSMIAGKPKTYFPKSPSELNPDIPEPLGRFILRLLEENPQDRFQDIESIITYVNRIQLKKYPFSRKHSVVTTIRFRSYLVRTDYAHRLLDYVPIIQQNNGKLVVVIGGEGVGKNNMLSLFRYHLLTDEFYLFDYQCSATSHDPFFALVKEFRATLKKNLRLAHMMSELSERFRTYLESEEDAAELHEESDGLVDDFNRTQEFIFHLSDEKPIIFVIRAGQYLTDTTIRFVNHISADLVERRILILISVDDPSKVKGLIHSIQFKIDPMSLEETREYIDQLLDYKGVPVEFARKIQERSCGIPDFIREILIDLTEKKVIWRHQTFLLDYDFRDYQLPEHLMHSVYARMSHLSESTYAQLQRLSSVMVPLTRELIVKLLGVDEKDFFFFIHDANNNEMLLKEGEEYFFAFVEARKRLLSECSRPLRVEISRAVLEFYRDREVTTSEYALGLIESASFLKDHGSVRRYKLDLAGLYSQSLDQSRAFEVICDVIALDFSGKIHPTESEIISDLTQFQEKAEMTGDIDRALALLDKIKNLPDIFEKHYLRGYFLTGMERHVLAREPLERSLELTMTGRQRILALISLVFNAFRRNDAEAAEKYLAQLDGLPMSPELKAAYVDRKGLYLDWQGETSEAIALLEYYLTEQPELEDIRFQIRLGSIYNNLAYFYIRQRNLEEATANFGHALEIWERVKYLRSLGLVYNNLGDLALRQGDTRTGFEFFQRAFDICKGLNQKRGMSLAFLNFAEANIKLGNFNEAEEYLLKAERIIQSQDNREHLTSVHWNLALAKGRVRNFGHYYQYIAKIAPHLIQGDILDITPLEKTWFYYLYNVGDIDRINQILQKNSDLDFAEQHEEEFYYQILGLLSLHAHDYESAAAHFTQSRQFAIRNRSAYAQAILGIREAQALIGLGRIEQARLALSASLKYIESHNFHYWGLMIRFLEIDLDLQDESVPLRRILRDLLDMQDSLHRNRLFMFEVALLERITQIYAELRADDLADLYYSRYREKVQEAVTGIPERHQRIYLANKQADRPDARSLKTIRILPRYFYQKEDWQEQLYDLFKLNEIERMKFFIDKTIQNLLAPYCYAIFLTEDLKNGAPPFLSYNMNCGQTQLGEYSENMEKAIAANKILARSLNERNVLFIPLMIRTNRVGCLVISDRGELEFRGLEMRIARALKLHLTSILMRIKEFAEMNRKMQMLQSLASATQSFFSIYDVVKLEQEIVSFVLDFSGYTRGFLIKRDEFGNWIYQAAMDDNKHPLGQYAHVSKTVLAEVQTSRQPVYTLNAIADNTFKTSISVQDYSLHSIFCAPILIDNEVYGLIYIDNYGAAQVEHPVHYEFMEMLMMQLAVALKNARQYDMLMRRNRELNIIDSTKDNFISIVSHELNNPLLTLQGYVHRLKKDLRPAGEDRAGMLEKVEESVSSLLVTTGDIMTLYRYTAAAELPKERIDLRIPLKEIVAKAAENSASRHMQVSFEGPERPIRLEVNDDAFQLMVINLVNNAIRFTRDFGTIVVGLREANFPPEKIDGHDGIVIYVQDNGIGIPEGELRNVFNKFYELNEVLAHKSGQLGFKTGGLGIGLTTARRCAELHFGKIWLTSKEYEGTTAFVALPYDQTPRGENSSAIRRAMRSIT